MSDQEPRRTPEWVEDAKAEISAMARQGIAHPSSKPVLIGAGLGALAGALIIGGPILGGLAGAGIALYQRIRK
jgi:predicted lipid-binding transport protein (Tim44 family)